MAEIFSFDDLFNNLQIDGPAATMQLPDPDLAQYWEDLRNRIIWVNDEITDEYLDFVSKLIYWNRQDKGVPVEERKPIRIFFSSPGGSLDVQDTLVSMIKLSKTPIYGVALGMVASAASMIFLATHKRYALPNAYFIFHRGSCSNLGGNYNEIAAAMDDYKQQIAKMEKYYVEHTLYTEEEIHKNISTDWYIRGNELVEKGIIHEWVEDIGVFL